VPKKPAPKSRRKSKIIYLSLKPEVAERIADEADKDGRTISGHIARIIDRFYSEA
jgi:hypothetical protein